MVSILIIFLAVLGHAAFWIGVINRWHAAGLPRPIIKGVTVLFYLAFAAPLALLAWRLPALANNGLSTSAWPGWNLETYLLLAAGYGILYLPWWLYWRMQAGSQLDSVRATSCRVVNMATGANGSPARGLRTSVLTRLPFNQMWDLHVFEYEVTVDRLPQALDGLSICHLSDLHMSGRLSLDYYQQVAQITNQLAADLVVLTGDICDHAWCIDEIAETLAPIGARHGKYFILGNHDARTHDVPRLRQAMVAAGFEDLGGRGLSIANGQLLIAGDERPWFRPDRPLEQSLAGAPQAVPRLLLAHTPDRFGWARKQGFDLLLAGHTHGGQIRFPLIGPVLCPSWHGVRYAAGFYQDGPTLMHVSQGTASLFPVRLLCPPEITKLVLRCPRAT